MSQSHKNLKPLYHKAMYIIKVALDRNGKLTRDERRELGGVFQKIINRLEGIPIEIHRNPLFDVDGSLYENNVPLTSPLPLTAKGNIATRVNQTSQAVLMRGNPAFENETMPSNKQPITRSMARKL